MTAVFSQRDFHHWSRDDGLTKYLVRELQESCLVAVVSQCTFMCFAVWLWWESQWEGGGTYHFLSLFKWSLTLLAFPGLPILSFNPGIVQNKNWKISAEIKNVIFWCRLHRIYCKPADGLFVCWSLFNTSNSSRVGKRVTDDCMKLCLKREAMGTLQSEARATLYLVKSLSNVPVVQANYIQTQYRIKLISLQWKFACNCDIGMLVFIYSYTL